MGTIWYHSIIYSISCFVRDFYQHFKQNLVVVLIKADDSQIYEPDTEWKKETAIERF
jgi:hypothetical protein